MWAFVSIEKTLLKENLKMYTMNIAYLRINSPQFLISENLFNQFPVFIGQFFKLIPTKFPRCQRVFLQPSSACVLIEILTRVHWGVDRVQQIWWKINSNISTLDITLACAVRNSDSVMKLKWWRPNDVTKRVSSYTPKANTVGLYVFAISVKHLDCY